MTTQKIVNVQIAFDADLPDAAVMSVVSTLLTEQGVEHDLVEDWRFTGVRGFVNVRYKKHMPFGSTNPDIFKADVDAVVIPVNTQGVPGAGLAKRAAQRWPLWARLYKQTCADGRLRPGTVVAHHGVGGAPILVDFPTKVDWREPSNLELIETGLQALQHWLLRHHEVKSIAVPALGCGLGGLRWEDVYPLLAAFAEEIAAKANVRVDIYPPFVRVERTGIGNETFWVLRRSDGATSEPYATPDTLLRAYRRGYIEWHE